ncbi:MAG: SDR family oxidoreductase, partial [Luteimonas sp.]
IAPFNIQVTLVEPGSARTNFGGSSASMGQGLAVYDTTPAGQMRQYVASGQANPPGDPVKMARAMITSVDQPQAPKRLLLGSDAYSLVHAALKERLAALEAQQELALSTDFDDVIAAR